MYLPRIRGLRNALQAEITYAKVIRKLELDIIRSPQTKTAVVVHLYYTDSWNLISASLQKLKVPFDLFVSLPKQNLGFTQEIKTAYKAAYVYEAPNRGRDVLPFIKLATTLDDKGYQNVLKLHSKKSTHRTDGSEWLNGITESLLPSNRQVFKDLLTTLDDQATGIIGPEGQYLQLSVNFEANGVNMTRALKAIYHDRQKVNEVLQTKRTEYGFFAGTMFWARLDALRPVIRRRFSVTRFASEAGQIDGTFAHALERVFCLVPEIDNKNIYQVGTNGIKKLDYRTDNIPDWSSVYIGPKQ